jgi:uncharacterized protein
MSERVFLSAQWLDLVMLNYAVDPTILHRLVPSGTELDSFTGKSYISLVGFRFLRTKLFGVLPLPFHMNFDELNLRFYVRRRANDDSRRGVVFISEIVPRRAVAILARLAYGENYNQRPMRHTISGPEPARSGRYQCEYQFRVGREWCKLQAEASGSGALADEGSLEQFFTEHYWGYAAQASGGLVEYRVQHVPWRVWKAARAGFEGDASSLYGPALSEILDRCPNSAFIAEGSPVLVHTGRRIG